MCLKVIKTVQFCKQKDKRNIIGETKIKQIMSENLTWKFEFYHARVRKLVKIFDLEEKTKKWKNL